MASYLVTGGAGFIGSHISDALVANNHQVYVLDNLSSGLLDNVNPKVTFVKGDIDDYPLVQELMSKVDGCFHLAAIVSIPLCNEDLFTAHQVNLSGTLNIIQAARTVAKNKSIPVVFASSCAVYGDNHSLPILESELPSPISFYAALKLAGEQYGRFSSEIYNTPFTALRLFNVYGARQRLDSSYSGVISIFLNNLLQNTPCLIYGDGRQSRDFVYVKDVAQFFIRAMATSSPVMRTLNVCTGRSTEINTIAILLGDITKQKLIIEHKPAKLGDIYHSRGNPGLAEKELGILANTSLDLGLQELVASIKESKK